MRILIYGAGTIGLSMAWLLHGKHEVFVYVRNAEEATRCVSVDLYWKDLRKGEQEYSQKLFQPNLVQELSGQYDVLLLCVNRLQYASALQSLSSYTELCKYFVCMLNHWNIEKELSAYLKEDRYILGFPSHIGGGREAKQLQAICFDESLRLGGNKELCKNFAELLQSAGLSSHYDPAMFAWLRVHYLQQSITGGVLAQYKSFSAFLEDKPAMKHLLRALREGVALCKKQGVDTRKIFPANLLWLPLWILAPQLCKMFLQANVQDMIEWHSKKGYTEWLYGYFEVLEEGRNMGMDMRAWSYYEKAARFSAEGLK